MSSNLSNNINSHSTHPAIQDVTSVNGSSIRVCLVSPVPPPQGGMGRWTNLVHQWAAGEPMISIVQVDTSPRWRAIDDLVVWKRVIGGGMQLLRDFLIFLKALRGVDVVHLTTSGRLAIFRDLLICVTARLLNIPVVYHLHFGNVPEMATGNTRPWRILSQVMKLVDIVLALDNTTAATIRHYLPEVRVEVAPNPIDLNSLPSPAVKQSARKTALFLGWMLPTKGVEELFQAWSTCAKDGWELVLAGPFNPEYRDFLVNRYQVHSISIMGELPHNEAMRLLAECDLFVLPSHTEAFPYVVLEAMSLGKPIIATKVGAIPEMLADSCGELVAAKDVAALATALTKLMNDEPLRKDFGARAYEKASSCYNLAIVMQSISSLWKQLAARQLKLR